MTSVLQRWWLGQTPLKLWQSFQVAVEGPPRCARICHSRRHRAVRSSQITLTLVLVLARSLVRLKIEPSVLHLMWIPLLASSYCLLRHGIRVDNEQCRSNNRSLFNTCCNWKAFCDLSIHLDGTEHVGVHCFDDVDYFWGMSSLTGLSTEHFG